MRSWRFRFKLRLRPALLAIAVPFIVGCAATTVEPPASPPTPAEQPPKKPQGAIVDVQLLKTSPDGNRLLIGLRFAPQIEFWDFKSGRRLWSRQLRHAAEYASFSPNGGYVLVGLEGASGDADVLRLDARTGKTLSEYLGAIEYASPRFGAAMSTVIATSARLKSNGEFETVELTWRIAGGKPSVTKSRIDRPPATGAFPLRSKDENIELIRRANKREVYLRHGPRYYMINSEEQFKLAALVRDLVVLATERGLQFVTSLPYAPMVTFEVLRDDAGKVFWSGTLSTGKEIGLDACLKLFSTGELQSELTAGMNGNDGMVDSMGGKRGDP